MARFLGGSPFQATAALLRGVVRKPEALSAQGPRRAEARRPPQRAAPLIYAVLAIGLAFSLAVVFRKWHLNGFPAITHWEWQWRNLGNLRTARALLAPFAVIAWVVWKGEKRLTLLVLSNFALQVFGMLVEPGGLDRVRQIVESAGATGYYTYALGIRGVIPWLKNFHNANLIGHVATHPPGPILFYYLFIKLFGAGTGALLGGLTVGFVGSLGVLVMYHFAGLWTSSQRARLIASALYALLPALTVFFPEFDQVYPLFSMLLVLFWVKALDGSNRAAVGLGMMLFVTTLFAYNPLTMGIFLVYYALYRIRRAGVVARAAGIALGVFAGLHLILWAATGYNAPASFLSAQAHQAYLTSLIVRPYATFVAFDLYDFALGAGIIGPLIVLLRFRFEPLAVIGLATILTVDASGLLRGETARVWLFLQPLWVVPVALELEGLRRPWLISIFAVQWLVLASLKAKMTFVMP